MTRTTQTLPAETGGTDHPLQRAAPRRETFMCRRSDLKIFAPRICRRSSAKASVDPAQGALLERQAARAGGQSYRARRQ